MSRRTPVLVLGLTVGDYLLWNWSLNGNHDVIALISGLTLPPLALVSLWVLGFGAVRTIAAAGRLARGVRLSAAPGVTARSAGARAPGAAARRSASAPAAGQVSRSGGRERPRKIAA